MAAQTRHGDSERRRNRDSRSDEHTRHACRRPPLDTARTRLARDAADRQPVGDAGRHVPATLHEVGARPAQR